jgi:hypothetical protein
MALANVLGWINVRLVFGAAFVLAVVPYALAFRLAGRRPLELGFDPDARSYRKPAGTGPPPRMDRPY